MSITIEPGSGAQALDRPQRLVLFVGLGVLGLAIAVGVFIGAQSRDPGPPEDVSRAIAIPALYATIGLLAIIGAIQRRPAIVIAAGVLCIVGAILSVATIEFVIPGILLIGLGSRLHSQPGRGRREVAIGAVAVLLVVSAGLALLSMTKERCWVAAGSPAAPTYAVIPCGSQAGLTTGGSTFASGFDSGVLTIGGGLSEAVLLVGAVSLAAVTGGGQNGKRVPKTDLSPRTT
jgi:uncharacterized membrane protein